MAIGKLWSLIGTRLGMTVLALQLALVVAFANFYTGYRSSDRCVSCHADSARMTKLGYHSS